LSVSYLPFQSATGYPPPAGGSPVTTMTLAGGG
jgi:hypothetical protein